MPDPVRPAAGSVEVRALAAAPDVAQRTLSGLIPYGIPSRDLGGWREVIEPGALDDADVSELLCVVEHDDGRVLGRHPATLTLEDTPAGMRWTVELPDTREAVEVRHLVERGDMRGTSWRMRVDRDRWTGSMRHVERVRELIDVAIVARPAYGPAAGAELRAYDPPTTTTAQEATMPDSTAPEATTPADVAVTGTVDISGTVQATLPTETATAPPADAPAATEQRSRPAAPTTGTEQRSHSAGGLRVERRSQTETDGRPAIERMVETMRMVRPGERRSLTSVEAAAVTPAEQSQVVWDALRPASVFLSTGVTVISTGNRSIKLPIVKGDVQAGFYGELDPITESDPDLDELEVIPRAVKALVRASSEVVDDSSPDLLNLVRDNASAALARRLDQTCFTGDGTGDSFVGLLNISGVTAVNGGSGGWDPILRAAAVLQAIGADGKLAVVLHPFTALALDLTRAGSTSENLYAGRPANLPPIFISSALPRSSNTAPAIVMDTSRVALVRRQDVTIEFDRSQEFSSDAVLIRGKLRAALAVPHAAAVAKVTAMPAPLPA